MRCQRLRFWHRLRRVIEDTEPGRDADVVLASRIGPGPVALVEHRVGGQALFVGVRELSEIFAQRWHEDLKEPPQSTDGAGTVQGGPLQVVALLHARTQFLDAAAERYEPAAFP